MKEYRYTLWAVFTPSKQVPGEWVGHCLELDVVSQGTSLKHAMSMLSEACALVVVDDLAKGFEPMSRRAPEKDFEFLTKMQTSGERVPLDLAMSDTSRRRCYAMPFHLFVQRVSSGTAASIAKAKAKSKKAVKPASDVAFAQAAC